ncbi:hypothetical protein QEN19_002671 [Hanseniaspora menglaensis]
MRSTYVSAVIACCLGLFSFIEANSESFGILTLHSGTLLQYADVIIDTSVEEDGYFPITVGTSTSASWVYQIDDSGHLIANESYYWSIIDNNEGKYALTTDISEALEGFYIEEGVLSLSGDYIFMAVPDGRAWDLYSTNSTGKNGNSVYNLQVWLLAHDSEGFAPNFTPSNFVNETTSSASFTSTETTGSIGGSASSSSLTLTESTLISVNTSNSVTFVSKTSLSTSNTGVSATITSSSMSTSSSFANSTSSSKSKNHAPSKEKVSAGLAVGILAALLL